MAKSKAYEIAVALGAKLDKSFAKTMNAAGGKLDGLKKAGAVVGKIGASIGIAALAATVAVAGLGVKATKQAMDLEKQMSNVGTLLLGTSEQVKARLGEHQKGLLEISNATGVVTSELSDGLYQVISALGDSEDALRQTEIAAKSAKAGNATTTDSINLLTAVTKGYGDTSAEAMQKASDLAFETLRLGQTSYPELAATMGRVIPLASTMRVSQEELFGAMATLTGVTGGAAEVTTQMRGALQSFLKPSKDMEKAMRKAGFTNGQVMLETLGLQGSLEALKGSVKGNELAFANLFKSVEAKNAVLALTGAQAEDFTNKTQAMYEAAGATDRAFAAQTNNLQDQLAKIKNMGTNALTSIGTAVLPHISKAIEKVMPLVEGAMAQLPGIVEKVSGVIGPIFEKFMGVGESLLPTLGDTLLSLAAAGVPLFMTLVDAVGELAPVLGEAVKGLAPLVVKAGELFTQILQPLIPVIQRLVTAALPPLTAAFDAVMKVVGPLIPVFENILVAILPPLEKLLGKVGEAMIKLGPVFEAVGGIMGESLQNALDLIMPVLDFIVNHLSLLIDFITNVFTGNWEGAWQAVASIFENIWNGLVEIFKGVVNFFIRGINRLTGMLNKIQIPEGVPLIGGLSFNIPQIPELYTGTDFFRGGLALVGERGPELVNMPRGSQVTPAQRTEELLSSAGNGGGIQVSYAPQYNITGNVDDESMRKLERQSKLSLDELKKMLMELKRQGLRVSLT